MGTIQEFFKNPFTLMMAFFIMLFVIKELFELWKWYKDRANDYHEKINQQEATVTRIELLEKNYKESSEILSGVKTALVSLNSRLDDLEEDRKEDFVVSSRATLYQLYEELIDKNELSLSEFETFNNLAERYLSNGGNGVFKNKIIPEIIAKPIKDD